MGYHVKVHWAIHKVAQIKPFRPICGRETNVARHCMKDRLEDHKQGEGLIYTRAGSRERCQVGWWRWKRTVNLPVADSKDLDFLRLAGPARMENP